jgi:hypothetical protein
MMRCDAVGLGLLMGTLAVLCARPALAEAGSCSAMAIEADASVSTRWPGLQATVREVFNAREDVDRCARVKLTSRHGSTVVEVVLPDGRSTSRSASRPEDVVPTLEALLLVPRREAPSQQLVTTGPTTIDPESGASPAKVAPSASQGASPASAEDVLLNRAPTISESDASPSPAREPAHLCIELSLATGARIGNGQASVGVGALSLLDFSGWLVGLEGRVDRYRRLGEAADVAPVRSSSGTDGQGPPDRASGALEAAVLGGRRVRFQSVALDFLVGPLLPFRARPPSKRGHRRAPSRTRARARCRACSLHPD